jgi:hypothetical protein
MRLASQTTPTQETVSSMIMKRVVAPWFPSESPAVERIDHGIRVIIRAVARSCGSDTKSSSLDLCAANGAE